MVSGIIYKRSDDMSIINKKDAIYGAAEKIYKFIWILRFRIKTMPEKDFQYMIKTLDHDEAIYTLFFRYI